MIKDIIQKCILHLLFKLTGQLHISVWLVCILIRLYFHYSKIKRISAAFNWPNVCRQTQVAHIYSIKYTIKTCARICHLVLKNCVRNVTTNSMYVTHFDQSLYAVFRMTKRRFQISTNTKCVQIMIGFGILKTCFDFWKCIR